MSTATMFRGNMVGEHRKGAYTMLCMILHWLPSDFLHFFACQAALFFVDYQLSYLSLEALLFKVGLSSGKMLGNQWLRVP